MASFQSYAGAYDLDGRSFRWRCYATAKLHDIRTRGDAPLPKAAPRKKWVAPCDSRLDPDVAVLVDEEVASVSLILLQIEATPPPCAKDLQATPDRPCSIGGGGLAGSGRASTPDRVFNIPQRDPLHHRLQLKSF